jgi:glycosyltransferase involved in cell wall biosynthesis
VSIIIPGGIGTGKNNIGVPVLEQIVRLLAKDFNVVVFQLFPVNRDYKPDGFDLINVYSSSPLLKIFKFCYSFYKEHRIRKFQIIHGFWVLPNGLLAVFMGKIFGIKSVISVLGGDAISLPEIRYGQLQRPLYRKMVLWALHHADEVTVLTNYLIRNLKVAGLKRDNIKVIPWGIDTAIFSFGEKALHQPIQLLHIANLHPVKDPETMVRAFKIINENLQAHLTIIGEGVLGESLRLLAVALNVSDKITFQSPLPYEELPVHYHNSDILLHTSLSEGQSEVVTEAMSCGVLVCGTNVGLMYDLPDCCISVPVGDFEGLGNAVVTLLKDTGRMSQIRQNAAAWSSLHSIHWTTERLAMLYSE